VCEVVPGPDPRIVTFAKEAEWVGQRVFLPSSILVLLFGILTTMEGGYGFTDLWILLGLIGIGLTIVTGVDVPRASVEAVRRAVRRTWP
jgi:hypothetical protein